MYLYMFLNLHTGRAPYRTVAVLLLSLQDLVSAVGDGPLLERIAKVMGYIAASSKGAKKGERDSAYIRSILTGGNPGSDAQVGRRVTNCRGC
jgi:hypothetical protein